MLNRLLLEGGGGGIQMVFNNLILKKATLTKVWSTHPGSCENDKKCFSEIPFWPFMSHFVNRSLFMCTYPFSSTAEVDIILSRNLQRFIVKLVTVSSLISPLLFDLQKKSSVSLVPVCSQPPLYLSRGPVGSRSADLNPTGQIQVTRISQLSPWHLRLFRLATVFDLSNVIILKWWWGQCEYNSTSGTFDSATSVTATTLIDSYVDTCKTRKRQHRPKPHHQIQISKMVCSLISR